MRRWEVEYVLVERPREELYERINRRVDKMMQDGLLQEAQRAFEQLNIPLDSHVAYDYQSLPNSVNTVGYKEMFNYFDGTWTRDFAIQMIQQNSRRYAKRQMTWFRRDDEIAWFAPSDYDKILQYIDSKICTLK